MPEFMRLIEAFSQHEEETRPDVSGWTLRRQERFDALSRRLSDAYVGVPVEEGMAEIQAAVAAERKPR
jgi:hypothetical protein